MPIFRTDQQAPVENIALNAGRRLRDLREHLGMTLRSVEEASTDLAEAYANPEFIVPPSRLSDIETKGVLPSIYRLHALALIYKMQWEDILAWYGIEIGLSPIQVDLPRIPKTHLITTKVGIKDLQVPVKLDPSFDKTSTMDLGRFVEQWGLLPLTYLTKFSHSRYTYGYIGTEDFTMYPILPPGSFVQVDQSRNKIQRTPWRSDYERPIYFLETRDEYLCAWCSMKEGKLIIQPHPLSPCEIRIMRAPHEVEVIGQVIGAAIRVGSSRSFESE
jgi:transcriptional regulator with XRE-family HTH domain